VRQQKLRQRRWLATWGGPERPPARWVAGSGNSSARRAAALACPGLVDLVRWAPESAAAFRCMSGMGALPDVNTLCFGCCRHQSRRCDLGAISQASTECETRGGQQIRDPDSAMSSDVFDMSRQSLDPTSTSEKPPSRAFCPFRLTATRAHFLFCDAFFFGATGYHFAGNALEIIECDYISTQQAVAC